ncbi:peptidyl-prolyl cis-trans isomerase [Edaphosphingomonas haloaromaticamans]|uniref:Parvulin-like PPIase n=1 Tax=Edaphosphingomonas haloaromaticamans TaxID=653954 RepID=A0A1S1HH10_9SPHN|nr:peptidyl-prolyl cis-trans isomerase [Sphingomonas haloaromaticamans]OHT20746.1 Peptidyl-prolyl cis-trans isomerase D [Sphingomonas haloaromaticamans]
MISFFRRALTSWPALALFALVLIAFAVTSIDPSWINGRSSGGTQIATIGGRKLSANEARQRTDLALKQAQRENPELSMAAFTAQGGVDQVIDQLISFTALEAWGRKQGISASDRLIDGEIASTPAFFGLTGRFDRGAMQAALAQAKISERQLRADIAGQLIRNQLLSPIDSGIRMPEGLILPNASLLLEQRSGLIGIVPSAAIPAGPAPTPAEIEAFYKANIGRFTVPERRVIRYALFGENDVAAPAAPTDAEIDAFYKANAATYGASETRSIAQVILPDQKAAADLVARVKAGTAIADAARQAGGEAITTDIARAKLAENASAAVADAVFAAAQGGVVGPIKADLGWYVVKVDAVNAKAERPLAAVRGEIAESLARQKRDEALSTMVGAIEDAIADGASFDDLAKERKLAIVTTPALLSDGRAPDQPEWKAPPELPLLLRSANQMGTDDDPVVETIGAGQRYALVAVSQVVPAEPAPLDKVRDEVVAAVRADRTAKQARAIADAILAKAKAGTPLADAIAQAPIKLPAPAKAGARQIELLRNDRPAPPPLKLMFGMKKGEIRLIAAPNDAGWFLVQLGEIVPGDARNEPALVNSLRDQFRRIASEEYARQFIAAASRDVGVKRNDQAIATLKAELGGQGQ